MARTGSNPVESFAMPLQVKFSSLKKMSNNKYAGRFIAFIEVAASDSGSGTGTIYVKDKCGSANP
jgi:hypothetical protein